LSTVLINTKLIKSDLNFIKIDVNEKLDFYLKKN